MTSQQIEVELVQQQQQEIEGEAESIRSMVNIARDDDEDDTIDYKSLYENELLRSAKYKSKFYLV